MLAKLALSIVVQIFKGKGDIRNCSCYRAVKLLAWSEGGGNGTRKILRRIVTVDEMQIGFMSERRRIDAVFILRRLLEDYHANGKKLYMCLWT